MKVAAPTKRLGQRFQEVAQQGARAIAEDVLKLLEEMGADDLKTPSGTKLLTMLVEDRLFEGVTQGARVAIGDTAVREAIARSKQRTAGKRSGAVRAERGHKARFLKWALDVNHANPSLSKNDVAYRYAKENPGTSVATLRRYLASIPNASVD